MARQLFALNNRVAIRRLALYYGRMAWNIDDLRKRDLKYAKNGVHMHQRPFHAARELLGPAFSFGFGGNPEVQKILNAYATMLPEANSSWPGMGIGLATVFIRRAESAKVCRF